MAENVELRVARHYARSGLEQVILDALVASGKDLDRLVPSDLAPPDGRGGAGFVITQSSEPDIIIGNRIGLCWPSGAALGFV
jgi:hypothetical protein